MFIGIGGCRTLTFSRVDRYFYLLITNVVNTPLSRYIAQNDKSIFTEISATEILLKFQAKFY